MHVQARYRLQVALTLSLAALLAACSSVSETTRNAMSALTPYKVEVVQGNFVSAEQAQALQPGMSRQQVREILGTPLLTSIFHDDRWEYVFTIKREGVETQNRKLTVFFENDRLARTEGDPMPSEDEFISSLGGSNKKLKIPPLQATEEQLARYQTPSTDTDAPAPQDTVRPRSSYPPLERGY